jgi:hypothetical protein
MGYSHVISSKTSLDLILSISKSTLGNELMHLLKRPSILKRGKDIQSNKNKLKVVKTSKPGTPQELSARPGSKDISEAHFLNAIHRSRPKPKILTLDNFAEEKLQIQVKDSQASQEQSHSPAEAL